MRCATAISDGRRDDERRSDAMIPTTKIVYLHCVAIPGPSCFSCVAVANFALCVDKSNGMGLLKRTRTRTNRIEEHSCQISGSRPAQVGCCVLLGHRHCSDPDKPPERPEHDHDQALDQVDHPSHTTHSVRERERERDSEREAKPF